MTKRQKTYWFHNMIIKHGDNRRGKVERLYKTWCSMIQRCNNPKCPTFHNYGGRGIKVCDEWLNYVSFRIWAFANGYSPSLTIDRIDNNSDYAPNNCRWVNHQVNNSNRRDNVRFDIDGNSLTMSEISRKYAIKKTTLCMRLKKGWSIKDALRKPNTFTKPKISRNLVTAGL